MKIAFITETFSTSTLDYYGRLRFDLNAIPSSGVSLQIAAKLWARVWLNDIYLGRTYVRTHDNEYRYETWDITPHLRVGSNVLAVHLHVWGQPEAVIPGVPPPCPARLAIQSNLGGQNLADWSQWRFSPATEYLPARRHNSLIGHEENRDMRLEPVGWKSPDFDDSTWSAPLTGDSTRQWNPSLLPPLREEIVYPGEITQQGRLLKGQMWEVEAPRHGMPFWRTILNLAEDTEFTFFVVNYVTTQVWVDGKTIFTPNEPPFEFFAFPDPIPLTLPKGRHVIMGYHCCPPALEPVGQEFMPPPVLRVGCGHALGLGDLKVEWCRSMHGYFEPTRTMRRDEDHWPLADTVAPDSRCLLGVNGSTQLRVENQSYLVRFQLPFNMTVLPVIEIQDATPGTHIEIVYSEFMSRRKGVDLPGAYVDRFTLRGGAQTIDVSFQYKSARILSVYFHAPAGFIELRQVAAIYRHFDYRPAGTMSSSDHRLEQIWEIGRNTLEMGSQDFIMDGAWREQLNYLGDSAVALHTMYLLFANSEIADWEFTLLQQGQMSDGLFQPTQPWRTGPELYRLLDQSVLLPSMLERHLLYTGKSDFVLGMMPTIVREMLGFQKLFGRMETQHDPRLRDVTGWNWVDHLGLEDGFPRSIRHSGIPSGINFLYLQSLQATLRLMEHFALTEEKSVLSEITEALRQKLIEEHWNPTREMFSDCVENGRPTDESSVQINILAILTDCAPEPAKLLHRVLNQSGVLQICGYYFRDNLYEAMRRAGMIKEILQDIHRHYGEMLDEGLTTMAENVPLNGHWWESVGHAYSTAPNIHVARSFAGLRPLSPGWARFEFDPRPCGLASLSVVVLTPAGEIHAEMQTHNGSCRATIHYPSALELVLPTQSTVEIITNPLTQ